MKNKKRKLEEEPFANNRIDYIINLISPNDKDKILNVGIST